MRAPCAAVDGQGVEEEAPGFREQGGLTSWRTARQPFQGLAQKARRPSYDTDEDKAGCDNQNRGPQFGCGRQCLAGATGPGQACSGEQCQHPGAEGQGSLPPSVLRPGRGVGGGDPAIPTCIRGCGAVAPSGRGAVVPGARSRQLGRMLVGDVENFPSTSLVRTQHPQRRGHGHRDPERGVIDLQSMGDPRIVEESRRKFGVMPPRVPGDDHLLQLPFDAAAQDQTTVRTL